MKKRIVLKCLCLFGVLLITSCFDKKSDEATSPDKTTSPTTSNTSKTSTIQNILTIDDVDYQFKNSKPTQVTTLIKYKYPSSQYNVELQFTSVLSVEYSDDSIKAKYVAKKEKINESLDGDFIITEENTYYCVGSDYGSIKDGSIVWNYPVEKQLTMAIPSFSNTYFDENTYSIVNNEFRGSVKSGSEKAFIGYDVTALSFDLSFSNGSIKTLYSTFNTEENAKVTISSSYSYNLIKVEIPS